MKFYRRKLEVAAIETKRQTIKRGPNQAFYETPKAIELWQEEPLARLKRWPIQRVFWLKDLEGWRGRNK